jgi:TetR/AcrR family transcriptional regulator, fatty acid biosynthesis regulator
MKRQNEKNHAMGRGSGGKQKLIEAALELASSTRSLASLGLREVTRYAGLAPNAFYRHFRNFDELGLVVVDLLGTELRRGLRDRRLKWKENHPEPIRASGPDDLLRFGEIIGQSVGLVLEFVTEHGTAYTVGIRELHGSSPVLRQAMERLLEQFAADMAEDVQAMIQIEDLDPATVLEISREVIRQMSFFSMDYLEHPEQRAQVRQRAERFIARLFVGEMAIRSAGAPAPRPRTTKRGTTASKKKPARSR